MKKSNLTGMRFDRLVARREAGAHITSGGNRQVQWECLCDCGNRVTVKAGHLRSGNTKSCGCLGPESSAQACIDRSTHGLRNHWIYKLWQSLIRRCESAEDPAFERYGGRGITVCHGIRCSPANLLKVLGERPVGRFPSGRPEWTIDRKNNDGGYWCGECHQCVAEGFIKNMRWATAFEQNQNARSVRNFTIDGETKCASAWAREIGATPHTITNRAERGLTGRQLIQPPRHW